MAIDALNRETVVLIHGWISHRYIMKPLEWRIQRGGYETRNWGYRSLRSTLEKHADDFANYLHELDQTLARPFHIITHSMGSIVTRCVLQNHQFEHLSRVVMLCPPNRGSHMASRVTGVLQGRLRGKLRTLDQISDRPDSFVNSLPAHTTEQIGIVIASGDLVVHADATQIVGATESVIVPGMHNSVLFTQNVADLCISFLRDGHFTASERGAQAHSKNG